MDYGLQFIGQTLSDGDNKEVLNAFINPQVSLVVEEVDDEININNTIVKVEVKPVKHQQHLNEQLRISLNHFQVMNGNWAFSLNNLISSLKLITLQNHSGKIEILNHVPDL